MKQFTKIIAKLFFVLLAGFFAIGCAPSSPNTYMNTSAPIFILNAPNDKSFFIDFKNFGNNDTNNSIAQSLLKNGYTLVNSQEVASIIIKGGVNYFRENRYENSHGFVVVGFDFDSHGRRSREVGVGLNHTFFNTHNNSFRYDGQASLLLRIKSGKKIENYSTNLNFQTDDRIYSKNYAESLFNQKISEKILEFLKFK